MSLERTSQLGASYLVVSLALLTLSLPVVIGLVELRAETELLAARNQTLKIASLIHQSAVESVLTSQKISMDFHSHNYTQSRDGTELNNITLLPPFVLEAIPKILSFYPSGTSSPGRISLRSKNVTCTLVLSLRGRTRTNCTKG